MENSQFWIFILWQILSHIFCNKNQFVSKRPAIKKATCPKWAQYSLAQFFLALRWWSWRWGDGAWVPSAVMSMHYKLLTLAGKSTTRRRQPIGLISLIEQHRIESNRSRELRVFYERILAFCILFINRWQSNRSAFAFWCSWG